MEMTEEGELKDRLVKIMQEQREKIEKLTILGSWWSNIHIIGISEKETDWFRKYIWRNKGRKLGKFGERYIYI